MLIKSLLVPSAALLVASCILGGCSDSDRQATTTRTAAVVPVEAGNAKKELQEVVTSLKNLSIAEDTVRIRVLQTDLKNQTSNLRSGLAELDASVMATIAAGNSQLSSWRTEAAGITDADMRAGSTKREGVLRKAVDDLRTSHTNYVTANRAYLSQLDEMIKTLDLDLTKQGVKSVRASMARLSDDDEASLASSINQVTEKSQAVSSAINS